MAVAPFVDTNVLLYLTPLGFEEPAKRERALTILESGCTLSVQVLNEFVNQAIRSIRNDGFPVGRLSELVDTFRVFPIVTLDLNVFDTALSLRQRVNYHWYDCLIVAAAITAGCDLLYSEDMQHGRVIDGVRIENPFRDLA